jgi:hypothetical protein
MNWHDALEKIVFGFLFGLGFGLIQWILGKILK